MAVSCRTYLLLSLLWATLLLSCTREPRDPGLLEETDARITSVVHYCATVGEGSQTKAALNIANQYIFETGDQLYLVDAQTGGDQMYGILNLVAGAGDPTGTFEGDLMCLGSFVPGSTTNLSATLVSREDKIHTCVDGKITGTTYPTSDNNETGAKAFASSFSEAVRYFSNFTATNTFSAHAFSLEQQSAFLIFSVTFDDTEAATITGSGSSTITATISNGGSSVRSGSVRVEEVDFSDQANFVAAFPASTVLSSATISFATTGNTPTAIGFGDSISDATLNANRYYEISRSHVDLDFFTIQAKENNTTITFNNTGDGLQYKKVGDATFTDYNSVSDISLNAREYVQFRGKKSTFGTKPLFTSDKPCFIYGDLMSLICDNNYTPKSVLASNAFNNAFNGATWIDIPSGRPLKLPATTLGASCYYQMFRNCTSLTRPPELATNLTADVPASAYAQMFIGCTSLVSAPNLQEGHNVGTSGYDSMFRGCTSLLNVPATISGTSGEKACQNMFYGCTSLTNAPIPTSSTVGNSGYYQMFYGCTSLAQAPALVATSFGTSAYKSMFNGCTSLTSAPASLPATALAANCYELMFKGCLSLSKVPDELPATSSAASCYASMFEGCISLNRAPEIKLEDIGASSCSKMFYGCSSLVTAEGLENAESVAENGCYQMFANCGELTTTPSELKPESVPTKAYYQMYYNCAKITEAPDIKATSVGTESCYQMFYGCRRLRRVRSAGNTEPALAVVEVAEKAFKEMFRGCASLASAPAFTGMTTVGVEGCMDMFNGCTNLTMPPVLPATHLSKSAYQGMFKGSGLTVVPELLATQLAESCYESMFQNCKYLEGPAVLPAKALASYCYRNMFNGASILNSVVCLATTDISTDNCATWLNGVAATGTFVRPNGVTWTLDSTSGIPTGWTVQDSGLDPIFPGDGPFNPEEDL